MSGMMIALLLVLAVGLIAVDFYLPGFILGSVGVVLMIVALFVARSAYGTEAWAWLIPLELALGAVSIWVSVKVVPRTRIGKKMFLNETQAGWRAQPQYGPEWLGREGVAHTVLRPGGVVVVDGKRLDAEAESGMISAGSKIKVVAVQDNNIIVRKV